MTIYNVSGQMYIYTASFSAIVRNADILRDAEPKRRLSFVRDPMTGDTSRHSEDLEGELTLGLPFQVDWSGNFIRYTKNGRDLFSAGSLIVDRIPEMVLLSPIVENGDGFDQRVYISVFLTDARYGSSMYRVYGTTSYFGYVRHFKDGHWTKWMCPSDRLDVVWAHTRSIGQVRYQTRGTYASPTADTIPELVEKLKQFFLSGFTDWYLGYGSFVGSFFSPVSPNFGEQAGLLRRQLEQAALDQNPWTSEYISRMTSSGWNRAATGLLVGDSGLRDLPKIQQKIRDLAFELNAPHQGTDTNTTMLIKEIGEFIAHPKDIVRLGNGGTTKRLANAFLSWKYGMRLTLADTSKLLSDLAAAYVSSVYRSRFTRASTTVASSSATERYHLKVYYTPFDGDTITRVTNLLREWHLLPSLVDLWDYVPYSFVVDWFISVGSILSFAESRSYWQDFPLLGATYGIDLSFPVNAPPSGTAPFAGTVVYRYYDRWTQKDLLLPLFPDGTGSGGLRNIPEALALIVQRR